MSESVLIFGALLVLLYGAVSRRAEQSVLTPPMVFLFAGVGVSPVGLGWLAVPLASESAALLAEIALVIILCSDAARVDRRAIRRIERVPIRLLLVGLPLSMGLGAALALWVFRDAGVPIAALALLGVVLSPTDAALGQAVMTSDAVPDPIRESINVESGLNDGISLSPVFALLFLLGADLGHVPTDDWLRFFGFQILLGPLAGGAVGWGGGRLIEIASSRDWVEPAFQRLSMPAIALLGYGLADVVGGNGFIGAFVAGFMLGVRSPEVREQMQAFGETEGTALSLLVMLLLGLVLVPATLADWSLSTTLYAVLSLTVARMLPVALSLVGLGLHPFTQLFLGWFGPRGIASIIYLLMWVKLLGLDGYEVPIAAAVQTITLSVVLHGLTAAPLADRYGRWAARHRRDAPETADA